MDKEFIIKILEFFQPCPNDLIWKVEDNSLTFFINCSDFFWWGCGDAEAITPETFDILVNAKNECEKLDEFSSDWTLLYCARVRKMRPQGAYYEFQNRKLWHLFDECGPEREPSIGNPRIRPTE